MGWTNKSPNGLEQIDKAPLAVIPECMPNGLKWKALIEEKRQEVLAERNQHIPSKSSFKIKTDPNENDVKIIDRSYLQKSFRTKSAAVQKLQLFALVCAYDKSTQVWRIVMPESCNTDFSTTVASIDKWFVVPCPCHLRAAHPSSFILGFAIFYITVRFLYILQSFKY